MNLIHRFLSHVLFHRELYLFPALAVLMIVGALAGVPLLTGRAVIDDPGAIVGWLYNFAGLVLVILLTGQAQTHLVGYRSKTENPRLRDDIFDLCATIFLLAFFAHYLWR